MTLALRNASQSAWWRIENVGAIFEGPLWILATLACLLSIQACPITIYSEFAPCAYG